MKTKVFIDGSEGTTGLRIHERLDNRDDIELLTIAPELRKDPAERSRLINSSDITFLCLPDSAARAVSYTHLDVYKRQVHDTASIWLQICRHNIH